jgi:hypothetical protein
MSHGDLYAYRVLGGLFIPLVIGIIVSVWVADRQRRRSPAPSAVPPRTFKDRHPRACALLRKLHQIFTMLLSIVGLVLGAWFGYQAAGILGVLTFTPLGALAGFVLGAVGWDIFYLLTIFT